MILRITPTFEAAPDREFFGRVVAKFLAQGWRKMPVDLKDGTVILADSNSLPNPESSRQSFPSPQPEPS
jgi:hypothetical protein